MGCLSAGTLLAATPTARAGASGPLRALALKTPPVISGLSDLVLHQNQSGDIFFNVSDEKTPAGQLTLQLDTLTPDLLPGSGLSSRNTSGSVRLTVVPAAGRTGTGTVQIRVTDGDGLATVATVLVTVRGFLAPSVVWENPAPLVYGNPLSAEQLNATAIPEIGVFSYTPPLGTILDVGSHVLDVVYTPSDANYTQTNKSVTLQVTKALPVLTWPNPTSLPIGSPLTEKQLNATATPPGGTFTYTPPLGAVLSSGTHTLTVAYDAGNSNYLPTSKSVMIDVISPQSEINWSNPKDIPFGTALSAAQLNATATPDEGTFTYTPSAGTILPLGQHTLAVSYAPADPVFLPSAKTVSITVTQAPAAISWAAPADIVFGTPLGSAQLNATATPEGGIFRYDPDFGTILPIGTNILKVTYTPNNANYVRTVKTVAINVKRFPAVVIWPTPADIAFGTPLSGTQLNAVGSPPGGTFSYSPGEGTVLPAGEQTLTVTYSPSDPNYEPTTRSVVLRVTGVTVAVTWATPAEIVYGTPLGNEQLNATAIPTGGTFNYAPSAGSVLNAGTHTLSVLYTPADGSGQPMSKNVTLMVKKAVLNVKADDLVKTYGSVDPRLTVTFSPFVNGEGPSVLNGAAGFIRDTGENAGIYAVRPIQGTLRADNYSFGQFQAGSITISKAPLTVRANSFSRLIGESNPAFTGSVSGIVNNESITLSFETAATDSSPAGSYAILPKLAPDSLLKNYQASVTEGTLLVEASRPRLSGVRRTANGFQATLTGTENGFYRIESTEALGDAWETLTIVTVKNGTATFDRVSASGEQHRYFRAIRVSDTPGTP